MKARQQAGPPKEDSQKQLPFLFSFFFFFLGGGVSCFLLHFRAGRWRGRVVVVPWWLATASGLLPDYTGIEWR